MKVKEIEALLPITRANIRFYEKEGLLSPDREKNGYRDYSEADVARLKQVILFRKLGISIVDIKNIIEGNVTISETVKGNVQTLQKQMEELQGAIDLCNRMIQDKKLDSDFSVDVYWDLMEKKEKAGGGFALYLKDYAGLEGNLFLTMWQNVFFLNLRETVGKRGWKITLGIVLGVCILRGLSVQFLWKSGSFWSGFSYPFIIFLLISIITLPLYILNKIYEDEAEGEESKIMKENAGKKKTARHPFLKGIAMLLVFLAMFFGLLVMADLWISKLTGVKENYIVSNPLYLLYMIPGLYLFALYLWLYNKSGVAGDLITGENGFKVHLPRRIKRKVMLVSVSIFVLCYGIYCTWYECAYEDGVSVRRLWITREYTWQDADYVTISSDSDQTLCYNVIMQDGTNVTILGGAAGTGDFNESVYPDEDESFVLRMTERFVNMGVPIKVDNWSRLNKQLGYEYWQEYLQKIHAIVVKENKN